MYPGLVAVSSRSFSKNKQLRQHLSTYFSEVRFNDTGMPLIGDALIDFLSGARYAIIGLERIDEALLSKLPRLKIICKMGTGVDKIDLTAVQRHGVFFSATPGLNKRSVSELALGFMLILLRKLPLVHAQVRQGLWTQPTGQLLLNKTVGIVGFGAVGQDLADMLAVFGCRCLVYDEKIHDQLPGHVKQVPFNILLAESDIISLHIPLLKSTYHLLDAEALAQMKSSCILINTARGGLVDEAALYTALHTGKLAGAAMDVFEDEPCVPNDLLGLDNFFATSHIGGSTIEAIEAMGNCAIEQLKQGYTQQMESNDAIS